MNKQQFLSKLKEAMINFPNEELDKAQMYYEEAISDRIEDGLSEEEAVKAMGDIDSIVSEIKINLPISKLIETSVKTSRNNAPNKRLWNILVIISFPFWGPLLFGLGITVLALYLSLIVLILSFFIVMASFMFLAILMLIVGFYNLIRGNIAIFAGYVGLSSIALGLFMMSLHPILGLIKSTLKVPPYVFMKIKQVVFR